MVCSRQVSILTEGVIASPSTSSEDSVAESDAAIDTAIALGCLVGIFQIAAGTKKKNNNNSNNNNI